MNHPIERLCFVVAETIGKSVGWVKENISLKELYQWQAYKLTQDHDWLEHYQKEKELEKSRKMTPAQRDAALRAMFNRG